MSKKAVVMVKLFIEDNAIMEMIKEANRRIKQELRLQNIDVKEDDFKKRYEQDEDNVRNSLVNVVALPMKRDSKGFNAVQIRTYNQLLDTLVEQICEKQLNEITLSITEWKLIKPYWEHDGEKVFGTAILDGVTLEHFHDKVIPTLKELTKEDLEPEAKE